jgi:tRNA dimethylallyltransferase
MSQPFRYIVIAGPTASGKSSLALELALANHGEIINCDSIQLYRGFNIGAAKPSADELKSVPHHLVSVLDYDQAFDARAFASMAKNAIDDVLSRGKCPIVVGGTGLYLRSLWQEDWHDLPKDEHVRRKLEAFDNNRLHAMLANGDPERAKKIHPNDRYRLLRANEILELAGPNSSAQKKEISTKHEAFCIYMQVERALLHQNIKARCDAMILEGFEKEVKDLLKLPGCAESKPMQSIGYKQMAAYLQGGLKRDDLIPSIIAATRQYAKRQETWFRKVNFEVHHSPVLGDRRALIKTISDAGF